MKSLVLKVSAFLICLSAFSNVPEKLDILYSSESNPEELFVSGVTKSKKTQKEFNAFVEKYSSVIKWENHLTFFYYLDKAKASEKLFVFTSIPGTERGVEMLRAGKTCAFYKTVELPENSDYVTYSFRKSVGFFMTDPFNPLCYCDARKSKLIRLSENCGAFVQVKDYEKSGYRKLCKRVNMVYLPAAYFNEPEKEFPVIYWLDGQNLWDNSSCPYGGWKVDTTMERLVKDGKCRPFIIAGLSSSDDRTQEYAGWCKGVREEDERTGHDVSDYELLSEEHGKMVVKDYIPFIEEHFRAAKGRENRFIAGSSYGAFESAWLLENYPETFCGGGLFSGGWHGYNQLIEEKSYTKEEYRIYMDCGTSGMLEKQLLEGTRNMKAYLESLGYKENENLFYQEGAGQEHNEMFWALRVPDFLTFISKD